MKVGAGFIWLQVTPTFKVVGICIIHFLFVLIEDLELKKVDSLLEEVNVAEVLYVQYKLCSRPVHIFS